MTFKKAVDQHGQELALPVVGVVLDNTITDPSTIQTPGLYIVPAGGTGVFAGQQNKLAQYDGEKFTFTTAQTSQKYTINNGPNANKVATFTGTEWAVQSTAHQYLREWHVDPVNGLDTNTGTEASPWKTIAKAQTIITGSGDALHLHSGIYTEAVTWNDLNVDIIGASTGGLTRLEGAWNFSQTTSSVRVRNCRFVGTVTHSGAGSLYFLNSQSSGTVAKTGNGYLEVRDSDFAGTGFNVTGAGFVNIYSSPVNLLNVNNASAVVTVQESPNMAGPVAAVGTLALVGSNIFATTAGGAALGGQTNSYVVIRNSACYTPQGAPAPISLQGQYTIDDVIFNEAASVITGTNVPSQAWFDRIGLKNSATIATPVNALVLDAAGNVGKGPISSGGSINVSYIADGAAFPASPAEGDLVYVTSDGTSSGSKIRSYVYDSVEWFQTSGSTPVSGAVIDNTIADSTLITTVGRYIVPASGVSGEFVGQQNKYADYDGTSFVFTAPVSGDTVIITSGSNAGQTWRFTLSWAQLPATSTTNVPAWSLTSAYNAGDLVRYTDGDVYYANGPIPASTAFLAGGTGATWRRFNATNFTAVANKVSNGALVSQEVLNRTDLFRVEQTTAGLDFTLPVGSTNHRNVIVINFGTVQFSMYGCGIQPGRGLALSFNGTTWVPVGDMGLWQSTVATANAVTTLGDYNNQVIRVTGSLGHTLRLPSALNLRSGASIQVIHTGTGSSQLLIQNRAGGAVSAMYPTESATYVLGANSTEAGEWNEIATKKTARGISVASPFTAANSAVIAGDSVHTAIQKLQGQVNSIGQGGSAIPLWQPYDYGPVTSYLSSTGTSPIISTTGRNNYWVRPLGNRSWEVMVILDVLTGSNAGTGDYLITLPAGLQFDLTASSGQYAYTGNIGLASLDFYKWAMPCDTGFFFGQSQSNDSTSPIIYNENRFRVLLPGANIRCWGSSWFGVGAMTFTLRFRFQSAA